MSLAYLIGTAVCAFFASALAIAVFKPLAAKYGWLDRAGADALKIHSTPTPFVGGLGIALGSLLSLAVAFERARRDAAALSLILGLSLCCAALGFRDDRRALSPLLRLAVEVSIGIVLAIGSLALKLFHPRTALAEAGPGMAVALILLYVTGSINAVNMQDGLDGLAGGVALIGCIGFGIVGAQFGQWLSVVIALALGGSLAAFLLYNFHPASVFMGDNGSYFVGFLLAAMALLLIFTRGTAWSVLGGLMLVGVPVLDAGFVIIRRLWRGVSPFAGDRSHFYDYLVKQGLSTRSVAIVMYALQACSVSAGAMCVLR